MGIWRSAAGSVRVRITSADFTESLKILTDQGIHLRDVVFEDDLSVLATVNRSDYKAAVNRLEARGDHCHVLQKDGIFWTLLQIRKRPVLIVGVLLLTILTWYIPTKVFFIQVQGNTTVPTRMIEEKVQQMGLRFGCSRKEIQNEQLKNILLESIPQLDWVGITTAGCVATVQVKEKPQDESSEKSQRNVTSMVAACDGVVESITVTKGVAVCRPGQAVRQGQVLISGYEDLGIIIKATEAAGEVYARTQRFLQSVTPAVCASRGAERDSLTNFSVQIGKNQINFFQDSGISPTGCVKMYEKKYLTLPGGFQLPLALVTEKTVLFDLTRQKNTDPSYDWMVDFSRQYVKNQMVAGEFIREDISHELLDEIYVLSTQYACREQIGKKRIEETIRQDGEDG